jgi:hypothetical protein
VYALPFCRDHAFRNHQSKARGILDDASGEFLIKGLHEGLWLLVAKAPDHVEFESWVDLPRDAGPVDITLPRTVELSGVVVDPTGAPIPQAAIFLILRSVDKRSGDDRERVVPGGSTDEDGRFELSQVPPGQLVVEVYSEDRNFRARTELDVESGHPQPELRVVLRTKAETPEMDRSRGRSSRR